MGRVKARLQSLHSGAGAGSLPAGPVLLRPRQLRIRAVGASDWPGCDGGRPHAARHWKDVHPRLRPAVRRRQVFQADEEVLSVCAAPPCWRGPSDRYLAWIKRLRGIAYQVLQWHWHFYSRVREPKGWAYGQRSLYGVLGGPPGRFTPGCCGARLGPGPSELQRDPRRS